MKRDYPLTLFAWCFVVLVAAFLPWGTVGTIYMPLFGRSISAAANGWTGSISVLGMVIPKWIEVVIASSLAFIGWLRAKSVFIRPSLPFWLGVYGLFHATVFILGTLFSSGRSAYGVGSFAAFVAFVGILRSSNAPQVETSSPISAPTPAQAESFSTLPQMFKD